MAKSIHDYITDLATERGWNHEVTSMVSSKALQSLVSMGRASAEEVRQILDTAAAQVPTRQEGPWVGDTATMSGADTVIKVAEIPDDQPEAQQGIWAIVDQYGETHRVEEEGDDWIVLIPAV